MEPNSKLFQRPHPGETEEDILAMQKVFLAEKEKNAISPSAQVINNRKHKAAEAPVTKIKQSKYARDKKMKPRQKVTFNDTSTILGDVKESNPDSDLKDEITDDPIYYPSVIPSILGNIVEKNISSNEEFKPNLPKVPIPHFGFPIAKKIDIKNETELVSSFQQDSGSKKEIQNSDINMKCFGDQSVILSGQEASDIHMKNTAMLANMTEQEILEEKEKLAATMDPGLLTYITSLRNKKNTNSKNNDMIMKNVETPTPMVIDQPAVKTELVDNEIVTHPNLNNWMHFDTLEREKLEWTQNMNKIESDTKNKSYEARFDFKGYLLPYSLDYTEETKILFHHGEEPHRPGYSLAELFELCRSTVTQQRSIALNTIAGILEYHSAGRYNEAIFLPITKIFFVLRFALDENIPIILEPCLKALRNLFYNRIDECLLDFLLGTHSGLIQPILVSHKTETEETDCEQSEIKDFHLAELDLIAGCLRSNMFVRLRYILTVIKPNFSCVEYCLQILIRLARCNQEVSEKFTKIEGLLSFIVQNFLPQNLSSMTQFKTDTERCKIVLTALKLVRILIGQSKTLASIFVSELNLIDTLKSYAGNIITENILLMKIQIETYYTWSSLLWYGYGLNDLNDLKFILLRILDNHSKGTDISINYPVIMHSHASALITLLRYSSLQTKKSFHSAQLDIPSPIIFAMKKWSCQVTTLDEYTFGHISSLSAAILYLASEFAVLDTKIDKSEINDCLIKMLKSNKFDKILDNIKSSSNLLSNLKVDDSVKNSNNPSLNSCFLNNNCDLPPTMSARSPFSLLAAISEYVLSVENSELSSAFVFHNKFISYISSVSIENLSLTDNWLTRIELITLMNILKCVTTLSCPDSYRELFYNLAFKLSYLINPEFKSQLLYITENIVFNKNWFSAERLLRNLSFSDTNSVLEDLPKIFECYKKCLTLDKPTNCFSLTNDKWELTVLPRDWMFMPIVGLYSKNQEKESLNLKKEVADSIEEYSKNIIVCTLNWILISEIYFPEVTKEISLTDRFCRLCCVFLCSSTAFLDSEVQTLLQKCFKLIYHLEITSSKSFKLNFDAPLIGINSFSELYIQLIDQFQAVSYGNPVFASCILVPLAQCHNVNWKKIIWSEYASCLRALDCSPEDLCYQIDQYLNPPELDFSLLKCYHRALNGNLLRKDTIPYKIAHHHVECAKLRQKLNAQQNRSNT